MKGTLNSQLYNSQLSTLNSQPLKLLGRSFANLIMQIIAECIDGANCFEAVEFEGPDGFGGAEFLEVIDIDDAGDVLGD